MPETPKIRSYDRAARGLYVPPFVTYRPALPPAHGRRPGSSSAAPGPGRSPRPRAPVAGAWRPRRPTRPVFLATVAVAVLAELGLFHAWRRAGPIRPVAAEYFAEAATAVPWRQSAAALPAANSGQAGAVDPDAAPADSAAAPTQTPEPLPTWTPGPEADLPIVPVIDGAMKDRLRAVHALGLSRGQQPEVFAKVGDSISTSGFFLTGLGCGNANLGAFGELAPVIDYFRASGMEPNNPQSACPEGNSFTRLSYATGIGWSAAQVLASMDDPPAHCAPPDDTPLRCELQSIRPGLAVVMFGTNEAHQRASTSAFRSALSSILTELLDAGVVPVLSTIPHRLGAANARVGAYNGVIIDVAGALQVPLVNYWRALQGPEMVRGGMELDGIHPNAFAHGASFSERGLRYGYNARNLVTLQALAKVKQVVIDDGPSD
jgi:hypothetical protein